MPSKGDHLKPFIFPGSFREPFLLKTHFFYGISSIFTATNTRKKTLAVQVFSGYRFILCPALLTQNILK